MAMRHISVVLDVWPVLADTMPTPVPAALLLESVETLYMEVTLRDNISMVLKVSEEKVLDVQLRPLAASTIERRKAARRGDARMVVNIFTACRRDLLSAAVKGNAPRL
jgi:hypothetical protein